MLFDEFQHLCKDAYNFTVVGEYIFFNKKQAST